MPKLRILGQEKVGTVKKTVKSSLGVDLRIHDQIGAEASDDVTIGSIRTKKPEQVEVRVVGQTLVKNVIRFFEDNYGIKIDVLTGDGGVADLESTLGSVKRTYQEKNRVKNGKEDEIEGVGVLESEIFEGQITQKQIDDAGVRYFGGFAKLTVMRVEEISAENGDYVSSVNGYLDGPTCRIGILRCDFNDNLQDSPLACFFDGELVWFSIDHDEEFYKYVVSKINQIVNLKDDEITVLKMLISEEDGAYSDCIPDGWSWTCGKGGEILYYGKSELFGSLAINITHFYEHNVSFDEGDEYGEPYSDETDEEEADEDTEFVAINVSEL